ncbi:MAG TPA: hypothetical protein EYH35_03835 [Thiotrichaceae bacterium]|nr:hypothetical protein [Thiotrichaceae bacterium]
MTPTQPFIITGKLNLNQLVTVYHNRRDEANDACTFFDTVTTGQLRLVEYGLNELTVQEQLASQIECVANDTPLNNKIIKLPNIETK